MQIKTIAHLKYPIVEPIAGGLEMHTQLLAAELRNRGHDITLFDSTHSDRALGGGRADRNQQRPSPSA